MKKEVAFPDSYVREEKEDIASERGHIASGFDGVVPGADTRLLA